MSPHPPEIFPPPHADSDAGLVLERTGTRGGQTSPVLVIPGLFNSGPDHRQSPLERTTPGAERVEQFDWERPTLGDWTASLVEAVRRRPGAILVGHSLGCALIAHLVQLRGGRGIGGALLVSPADVNRDGPAGRLLTGFSPIPRLRFPFPSTVVASRNDPYVAFERAEAFARGWGSDLVDLGRAGHINVEAGYGPWPRARRLVDALIAKAERSPRADR
jgi:predicted alpha/beta hydrolase family esterase